MAQCSAARYSDPRKVLQLLDTRFERRQVSCLNEALKIQNLKPNQLIDIVSPLKPAQWLEQSARAALDNKIQALVTGPMSKIEFQKAGFQAKGHTQLLKHITGTHNIFMMFLGAFFNTVLITEHISLAEVPQALSPDLVYKACELAYLNRQHLQPDRVAKPLALLGLNPHAGEGGVLGREEQHILQPAVEKFRQKYGASELVGPLVPDVAFQPAQWPRYAAYICPYHDQALIAFKAVHAGLDPQVYKAIQQSLAVNGGAAGCQASAAYRAGAQISLGLTFVRTSVDHGVASDIFGHNKARPDSMLSALEWAMGLAKICDTF